MVQIMANAMDSSKLDVKYNEQATLPENLFTKKYHTFKGWSTTPNGEVAFIDQANVYELAFNQGDVVRLYAVWERNQVEVTVKRRNLISGHDFASRR